MNKKEEIRAMGRKELAANYGMKSTKTLNRVLKRFGLLEEINRSPIVPPRTIKKLIECYGHWKYEVDE